MFWISVAASCSFKSKSLFFGFLLQGKGEFAMEYSKYLAASQQVQAELMEKYDLERLKKAKSR